MIINMVAVRNFGIIFDKLTYSKFVLMEIIHKDQWLTWIIIKYNYLPAPDYIQKDFTRESQ
jgi:hypothetical protein